MLKAEQDKSRYENEMIDWNARLQVEAAEAAMEPRNKKKKKNHPSKCSIDYYFECIPYMHRKSS